MSYGIPLNGLPHGDPVNSYIDREAREAAYEVERAAIERFGEASQESKTKGQSNDQRQRQPESDAANG